MEKQIVAISLLAVVSGSAAAEWVSVGIVESGTVYADSATRFKAGDKVKMWHLVDYSTVQVKASGRRYISERLQYEYDCKDERARMLSFLAHTGNMGTRAMVDGDWRPQKWEPIRPGSIIDYLWRIACGRQ